MQRKSEGSYGGKYIHIIIYDAIVHVAMHNRVKNKMM